MFSSRSLFGVCEGNPFVFLFFEVLFGDVLVYIEAKFSSFGFEGGEICLDSFMELLGELPYRFAGESVEVVVAFGCLVVKDFVRLNELVNLLRIHFLILNYLLYRFRISFNSFYFF